MYDLIKPSTITFIGIFLANLIFCRMLVNHMTNYGMLRHGTEQYRRTFYFYWIPIMGALGLLMLYFSFKLKAAWNWLFLSHHKPAPVPPASKKRAPRKANNGARNNTKRKVENNAPVVNNAPLTDEEIMKRASEIGLRNAKAKIAENLKHHAEKKNRKKAYSNGK